MFAVEVDFRVCKKYNEKAKNQIFKATHAFKKFHSQEILFLHSREEFPHCINLFL